MAESSDTPDAPIQSAQAVQSDALSNFFPGQGESHKRITQESGLIEGVGHSNSRELDAATDVQSHRPIILAPSRLGFRIYSRNVHTVSRQRHRPRAFSNSRADRLELGFIELGWRCVNEWRELAKVENLSTPCVLHRFCFEIDVI